MELFSRTYISRVFNTGFWHTNDAIQLFYPELGKLKTYAYDSSKINLLVLGGSVVYDQIIEIVYRGDTIQSAFCNMMQFLPDDKYNILSLSGSGHNSLDSRYKYSLLKKYKFDYVFVYHGINDTRANNIVGSKFDAKYRHIEFYDDLSIYFRHPEVKYYATVFAFDWMAHSVAKKWKTYIPKEFLHSMLNIEASKGVFDDGDNIKTEQIFKSNLEDIISRASDKNESVLLSTYAWYLDSTYTLQRFREKLLDYDEQLWPAELYGDAGNVAKGLKVHNKVIRKLSEKKLSSVLFIDAEKNIVKGKENFNDICHLNANGCQILANLIIEATLKGEE